MTAPTLGTSEMMSLTLPELAELLGDSLAGSENATAERLRQDAYKLAALLKAEVEEDAARLAAIEQAEAKRIAKLRAGVTPEAQERIDNRIAERQARRRRQMGR